MVFVMKKYVFLFFTIMAFSFMHTISCCPFGFSPEDQRPFFEQYEDSSSTAQEKEK